MDARRVTPSHVTYLDPNEVLVFGSNAQGAHAGGAARFAHENFGAVWGQAEGLQGRSYGIDSMSGLGILEEQAARFVVFARQRPELRFLVTEIGCGIAGYTPAQVAPFFAGTTGNVLLPESFHHVLHPQTSLPGFRGPDLMGTISSILGLPGRIGTEAGR